jgi:hypothetical protein
MPLHLLEVRAEVDDGANEGKEHYERSRIGDTERILREQGWADQRIRAAAFDGDETGEGGEPGGEPGGEGGERTD